MNLPAEAHRYREMLQSELPYLREHFGVENLGIFGSYVRGDQTAGSDLDVLVTFTRVPGLIRYVQIENYLSDKLGIRVDLVDQLSLKNRIGELILAEVVPV